MEEIKINYFRDVLEGEKYLLKEELPKSFCKVKADFLVPFKEFSEYKNIFKIIPLLQALIYTIFMPIVVLLIIVVYIVAAVLVIPLLCLSWGGVKEYLYYKYCNTVYKDK